MAVVSLQDVIEAMDVPNSEWAAYLNPSTGEIAIVTEEDRYALELFFTHKSCNPFVEAI